jgi:tetratricopeptide (TPR) repeat protein
MPDFYPIHLSLAGAYVRLNRGQDALNVLADMRGKTNVANFTLEARMSLLHVEAWAHAANSNLAAAESLLRQAQSEHPRETIPFTALANIYWTLGRQTNAMEVLEQQLVVQPDAIDARISLSAFKINSGNARDAVAIMDTALQRDPKNLGALLNRAIAHLTLQNTAEARRDYRAIQSLTSKAIPAVHYGLGECAWLEKDFKNAALHFEEFLKYAPKSSPEYRQTDARIKAIQSGTIHDIPASVPKIDPATHPK